MIALNIVLLCFLILFFSVGLSSNIIILLWYPFKSKNTTHENAFIRILTISDLLVCIICFPSLIIEIFYQSPIFCTYLVWCSSIIAGFCVFTNLFVSVERWFSTFKPFLLRRKHIYIINVCNCLGSIMFPALNYASNRKNSKTDNFCFTEYVQSSGIFNITTLVIICIIFLIEVVLYTMIFSHLKKRVPLNISDHLEQVNEQHKKRKLKIAAMLFGTSIVWISTWIPTLVTSFHKFNSDKLFVRLFLLNNCINCLVYLLFHKKFRNKVHEKLKKLFKNSIQPKIQ